METSGVGEEEERVGDSTSGEETASSGTEDGEAIDWDGPREVQVGGSPCYKVKRQLGSGSYGKVFLGCRASGSNGAGPKKVAVKFERISNRSSPPQEWQVYGALEGCHGVPKVYYTGEQENYFVMIMEMLGTSLLNIWRESPGKSLSAEMVGCIAAESLAILENLHARGYAHGDIKPDNIMLGPPSTPDEKKLFFVDMGLARRWRDDKSGEHVEYDQCPGVFRGSYRYASVHSHLGRTYSRRDDLESLAYTLIYLHRGSLPWQGPQVLQDNRIFLIGKSKRSCSPEMLFGPSSPPALREFLEIVINMKFDEEPKYSKLISLFESLLGADPDRRPFNTDAALESIQKRTRDEEDEEQPRKLIRLGSPRSQWIAVYNERGTIKQRYYFDVPDERLATHINSGTQDGMHISCVASHSNLWAIIMNSGTNFSSQVYHIVPLLINGDWITAQWDRDYQITSLAGADQGNVLVVMSRGSPYRHQCYNVFNKFPYRWIAHRWTQGYFVTSMASIANKWVIVMSRNSGYNEQVVALDYMYPMDGTSRRSAKGFRITSIAATVNQVAVILSLPWHNSDEGIQSIKARTAFPIQDIEKRREKNCYVSYLCFGPTTVR